MLKRCNESCVWMTQLDSEITTKWCEFIYCRCFRQNTYVFAQPCNPSAEVGFAEGRPKTIFPRDYPSRSFPIKKTNQVILGNWSQKRNARGTGSAASNILTSLAHKTVWRDQASAESVNLVIVCTGRQTGLLHFDGIKPSCVKGLGSLMSFLQRISTSPYY